MSMEKHESVEMVECTTGGDIGEELTHVLVLQEKEQRGNQFEELTGIPMQEQAHSSNEFRDSENMHELSSIITDVYSLTGDKFGNDIMQFIEPGHGLEHWHQHGYPQDETDSFPPHIHGDSMPQCNDDTQSPDEASVTLTVLNSTSTEEATQAIPFSLTQPVTHHSLIDHNYYCYPGPKEEYSVTECLPVDNSALLQEQNDMGMDQEKLQRMKRRKEKNRECSRQFRLKQKDKEQKLTFGKIEKSKNLESMKRNVEKLKAILSKISQKCSNCPKAAVLLSQYVSGGDKENINPNIAQNFFK